MGDKEDYLTSYRVFFENFAATVNPEDQLPVNIAGYTITEAELPGEVLYWTTQYLTEKQCPLTLMTPLRRIILDEVRIASKKTPIEFGYKTDEAVYIALRLMQAVTARVNAICLRYLDNSMLDSLPPPPPVERRDMKTVSCATKNSRRVMEDRHVEIGNLEALFGIETTEPTSFYAVYDGHAGSAAATYCAAHLHQYLVESQHFRADLRRAMRDAFLRTDEEFVRKSNQERACGGSTAVAVAVRARRLLAAWAGDSLALLAKRMRLMQLVRPHKPGRQDERERIESSGGTVIYWGTWRVNGQLAVSRAIGDAQYKPFVTARPETAPVDLDGDEDFVVVACDGLWDFVSEDDVALSVYRQLAADPDDLKAVTKRLIAQAKRQGSADNISIIVVFLKEPRQIAADNCPPMDLGLDNALASAPPFAMEAEACKRQLAAGGEAGAGECADGEPDNGVDNSDSDSEDLGPETAVDVDADDVDADARNHHPAPPTPPADAMEEGHVDGALVDNVAESGEESEDEWNYFKGEGEREEANPSEEPDDPPRSETPCQDNSAWESSSVDMNSSPLNPDAPVFVPGSVAGSDVLLAESPRKPLPMDDIELPDVAQFETEAVVRPAELLDLDNCDQLNGHHNVLDESIKEQLNGNNKYNMDSLGFGFSVGTEPDKGSDGLIQDFERIQKDTTDFCNIQVFQAHTETNPFASDDNDELLERLKNKERDPMSMSFYQEKDDDTCERLANKNTPHVDLNAVQPLPDSDDEDLQTNGVCELTEHEKENISPEQHGDLLEGEHMQEPNNDIIRFDERKDILASNPLNFGQGDNFIDYNDSSSNNMQSYANNEFNSSNIPQDTVAHTDTPESHKLLFEQIPEIPDGKSSELGFTTEDLLDQTESEKDTRVLTPQEEMSQDVDMESKNDESPCIENSQAEIPESQEHNEINLITHTEQIEPQSVEDKENEIIPESEFSDNIQNAFSTERLPASPLPVEERLAEVISPEVPHDVQDNVKVDIHQSAEQNCDTDLDAEIHLDQDDNSGNMINDLCESILPRETPDIKIDTEELAADPEIDRACSQSLEPSAPAESPLPSRSPLPSESPLPAQSPTPVEIAASPLPAESPAPSKSPLPAESPAPPKSPFITETLVPHDSPQPTDSPVPPRSATPAASPVPLESPLPVESPAPPRSPEPDASVIPEICQPRSPEPDLERDPATPQPAESFAHSPLPADVPLPRESPLPVESPLPAKSPLPAESTQPAESPMPIESPPPVESPLPVEATLPIESPPPAEEPVAIERSLPVETSMPREAPPAIDEPVAATSPLPVAPSPVPAADASSPAPADTLADHAAVEARLSPEVAPEPAPGLAASAGPAPDIVPEEPVPRSDLVTDIDIGVPESRAQEICVPVTSEIGHEDAVQAGAATPPPTPAVDAAPTAPALDIAPVSDTPIAADVAAAVAVGAAAAAGVAAVATTAAKAKTPAAKKSPTTPTAAAKTTPRAAAAARPAGAPSPRTPASATKKPAAAAPAAPAARPSAAARTPASGAKPAAPAAARPAAARTSAAKPAAPSPRAAPKPSPAAPPAARAAPAAARAPPARAPSAAKAPAPRPATAPAARPAPKPAAARPAAARPAPASAPAPRPAPITRPKEMKPKAPAAPEKKPLTNGDAKEAKPAPRAPAARPAPARAAPRPAPRAPAAAAPAQPKTTTVPKAAPRVPAARPLDKQTKDLANKRITAKAAPPRTAATKAPPGGKGAALRAGKAPAGEGEPRKAPPSPPLADNALLPDVIA